MQKSIETFKREVRKTFGFARFFIYEAGEIEVSIMANSDITKLVYRMNKEGGPIIMEDEWFY